MDLSSFVIKERTMNPDETPRGSDPRAQQQQAQPSPQQSQGAASSAASSSLQQGGVQAGGGRGAVAERGPSYGMPSLFGGGPFELLRRLDEDMDRLFDEVWGGGGRRTLRGPTRGAGSAPTLWTPQVEMCEQGGKFHVYADLPGLRKEDVKLSIEDDAIVLQGERRSSREEGEREGGGFYRSERGYGSFYRTIPLPEGIDSETAEASFRDGVLDVCFDAPARQQRTRHLEIKEAPAAGTAAPRSEHH
jgi:HSP20 family protein